MEVRGPGPQGALLRPRLLRARGRAAVAPGLADGVPARGDPAARRLRRVRDPRPVDHRGAHRGRRRRGRSRTPAATAASRSPRGAGRCESGFTCPFHGWCYGPDGKNTFVPRKKTFSEHNLQRRRHRPHAGAVRDLGRLRLDQPRPRRPAAAGVHRAVRHDPRRLEGRVVPGRVVVRVPPPGELEAGRGRVRRAVPRAREPSAAAHPRAGCPRAIRRPSTPAPSSTPRSTTCAR